MHKSDLVKAVATNANMNGPAAEKAVNAVFESIKEELKKGEKVTLTGFGTFEVANQAAREGRNPKTNSKIRSRPANASASALAATSTPSVNSVGSHHQRAPENREHVFFVCRRSIQMENLGQPQETLIGAAVAEIHKEGGHMRLPLFVDLP